MISSSLHEMKILLLVACEDCELQLILVAAFVYKLFYLTKVAS